MSTIQLKKFEYYEPDAVSEAAELLKEYGGRAQIQAGGIDLIPRLRSGSIKADALVNISNIPGLEEIRYTEGEGYRFGAMTRLRTLDFCPVLKAKYPAVQAAIHQITSVQSKYMGTAVGNLCLATPASDVAPALMAYDAELTIAGTGGERKQKLCDFYLDYRKTSLAQDEFVTGVFIPEPAANAGDAFFNRVRTHADIAKITVVAVVTEKDGVCTDAKIAVGAVAPTVIRIAKAEDLLKGQKIGDDLFMAAAEETERAVAPISDFRSTAEYRREMTRMLTYRALQEAFERAERSER